MWTDSQLRIQTAGKSVVASATSRRHVLTAAAGGFGWLAAQTMLHREAAAGIRPNSAGLSGLPTAGMHHLAKAKAVIQIFCPGGMSQVIRLITSLN